MTLPAKDPAEIVTVEFDFTALSASVANPDISIAASYGLEHADPSAMLSGDPTIDGAEVRQRVTGGQAGTTYTLRCVADAADGSRYVLTTTLPVVSS